MNRNQNITSVLCSLNLTFLISQSFFWAHKLQLANTVTSYACESHRYMTVSLVPVRDWGDFQSTSELSVLKYATGDENLIS
jgi:hypothetical protein